MGIGVLDDGRQSIAVQGEERRLLQLGSSVDLGRVGDVELLQKNGYLPRVRSGWSGSAMLRVWEGMEGRISYDGRGGLLVEEETFLLIAGVLK